MTDLPCLHTKKVAIGRSGIHGWGVIAKRDIKKGEAVFIIKGKRVQWPVKDKTSALYGPDWIGVGKNTWVDSCPPADYLNHSCDPNAGIRGSVTVVALRNIRKGEEVTIDYSITEEVELWSMRCNCSSTHCRRIIRSIQFLPPKVYNSYLPAVPRYFQKVYTKAINLNNHG